MQLWASRLGVVSVLLAGLAFGQQPDRITEAISTGQMVPLAGNTHALARPQFDQGRVDGRQQMYGVTLAFKLSSAAQQDLDVLLTQLQDRKSANYHKFLTVAEYADRFGMSQRDINKIVAWLLSEGFTNVSVANNRMEVSFDGTVAQVERVFATEIHTYLVNGEVHFANSTDPSVPAALAGTALAMRHLNNFAPKPRVKVQPHLTSYVSGNHYLAPGDFATIYDINPLYSAGSTGSNQSIAIVGQSTINTNDLNNFRSAAGLPASTVKQILIEGTGTRCSGDELESDLDLEWSGGVAKAAQIYFVYAGLGAGDTCQSRFDNVWDAIEYALTTPPNGVAPFVSTSYGACESANGLAFAQEVQGWVQEGQTQGQTLTSASGDAGAADCDSDSESVATQGLAVDMPASIPEVTGAGGNEFTGDGAGTVTGTPPDTNAGATQYWAGTTGSTDNVDSALSYIPEEAWNDTAENDALSASGGGASIYFTKPTWQTGTGVPSNSFRDVPDIAISASPDHDPYLICSEDNGAGGIVSTCVVGFRDSAGGDFDVVGGTSAAAPTFTAIMALVNQYVGNTPPTGLAPINPTLYTMPGNNPNPFHDITTGNNIVPCETGTPDCTTGSFGYSAGVGYDQVTGLGSLDAFNLATIWARTPTTTDMSVSPGTNVNVGTSVTFTATVTPSTVTGSVSFYDNGSTTALGSGTVSSGTATFMTSSLPQGSNSVIAVYSGDSNDRLSTSAATVVTVTGPDFTVGASPTSVSVVQGATSSPITVTITPTDGFNSQVTFSCSGLPTGATCSAAPVTPNGTNAITTSLTVTTSGATPAGTSTVTITATGPSTSHTATFSLTVTAITITLTSNLGSTGQLQVTQGQSGSVTFTVGPPSFLTGTQTSVPVTYTCLDHAPESTCTGPLLATQQTSVSFMIQTTAPTAAAVRPLGRGTGVLYAVLFPGLIGVLFTVGSRRRALSGMRLVSLIALLGFSTLWLGSCSGSNSSSTSNGGTTPGPYQVTVNATTSSGDSGSATFTLNVAAQ